MALGGRQPGGSDSSISEGPHWSSPGLVFHKIQPHFSKQCNFVQTLTEVTESFLRCIDVYSVAGSPWIKGQGHQNLDFSLHSSVSHRRTFDFDLVYVLISSASTHLPAHP